MSGRFIVSLDCEGKWGMADKLQPYHHRLLTDDSLARVYEQIVGLLSRYELAATFAYVLAFTLTAKEREQFAHFFQADGSRSGGWLSHFHAAQQRGKTGGWFQPRALEVVRQQPQHEVACHGFCHRPMAEDMLSADDARAELDAAESIASAKGLRLSTFVYPRNKVGHVSQLARKGYIGYRGEKPHPPGHLARLKSLAEELDVWPQPEVPQRPQPGGIVRIPPGLFFNWRHGARRRIPALLTVQRWKTFLNRAAERGQVAHLWFHPHNLITAPETLHTLEAVLAHAARLRAAGRLQVVTQETYCRELLTANEKT